MPTGYTAQIKDGITFKQFIMSCAKAFGACIEMRDDPSDTPIPEKFDACKYHQEKMDEIEKALAVVSNMSTEEATRAANSDYNKEYARIKKYIKESDELYVKYHNMLKQVKAWSPPSSDHIGLKDFMIEQIENSIEHDCSNDYYEKRLREVKHLDGLQWRKQRIESLTHDLKYHAKEQEEDNSRTASNNSWVKALRKSLEAIK